MPTTLEKPSRRSLSGEVRSRKSASKERSGSIDIDQQLHQISTASKAALREQYRELFKADPPKAFGPDLLRRAVAYRIQENAYGGFSKPFRRELDRLVRRMIDNPNAKLAVTRRAKPGTELVRDWKGKTHRVLLLDRGFSYGGRTYSNLSEIARSITGTRGMVRDSSVCGGALVEIRQNPSRKLPETSWWHSLTRKLRPKCVSQRGLNVSPQAMASDKPKILRCAIYTRKSTDHGLELEFNSLHAQREACEAYIKSQASLGLCDRSQTA